jgi:hypothetical protein
MSDEGPAQQIYSPQPVPDAAGYLSYNLPCTYPDAIQQP